MEPDSCAIPRDSQDTYCEVTGPSKTAENESFQCSQPMFSEDYCENASKQIHDSACDRLTPGSDDVKIITSPPNLIIMPSDSSTTSNSEDISKFGNDEATDSSLRKRQSSVPVVPNKKICIIENSQLSSTDLSNSETLKNNMLLHNPKFVPHIFKCDITPVKVLSRNGPRDISKRRNSLSCNLECRRPARRLKRCLSADIETRQNEIHNPNEESNATSLKSYLLSQKLLRIDQSKNIFDGKFPDSQVKLTNVQKPIDKHAFTTINEECTSDLASLNGSQGVTNCTGDSENIVIEFSPSQSSYGKEDSQLFGGNKRIDSNWTSADITPLNKYVDSNSSIDKCDMLPLAISSGDDLGHLDSTVSINIDSPSDSNLQSNPILKAKPHISNGCTSSTPQIFTFDQAMQFKAKNILLSDSDSNVTPPFREYQKSTKFPLVSKIDSSNTKSNTSISPISNGHSDASHAENSHISNPSFDFQIHCDDNNEFLSLVIVKTDNEIGMDMSKEFQKISKRINSDQYGGDISKANSSSSVTSGGLLQLPLRPRTSFMSSSSSNSTSSARTHDGAFIIPQRRDRSFVFQSCTTIKNMLVLKNKVDDLLSHLIEIYGIDDHSLSNLGDKISANNTFEKSNGKSRGENTLNHHPNTPKSSKKKLQSKPRRNGNFKTKKVLPSTTEEMHINGEIHSPEMIATDPSKCGRPNTPINNNSPKLTPKSKSKKESNACPTSPKMKNSPIKSETISHCPGTLVLAKWVDKLYYSGIVKKNLDINRYMIEFYDGQVKILFDDFIIFGNTKELPILGQSIYAIVDDDQRYEPSLVLSLVENEKGKILYQCTTDRDVTVSVNASDIYVTEDQAKSIRDSCIAKSPQSAPNTPRRRVNRELDLDNIIHGPRSARLKNTSRDSALVPRSPEASTSGLGQKRRCRKSIPPKQRQESESSEGGEATQSRAPSSVALEEVSGVQPEIQKTPRKIEGVKIADALLIKGISKQNTGKRCSKVTKFENDSDTNNRLGPIPPEGSTLFKDLHFLLTHTDPPTRKIGYDNQTKEISFSDSESYTSNTEKEDCTFTNIPFNKERIKEQLEAGGGIVYSHFEDIPKDKYNVCKLIAARPCFTAKYIQCLGADIKALSHVWVIRSCLANKRINMDEDILPAGWSLEKSRFINWRISPEHRKSANPFKDYLILLCSDNDNFMKFWRRVCTLAGGETRVITDDLDVSGGLVIVTESDCPHEVQNKAVHYNIPLVSTTWVVQCLIEGRICDHNASVKFNFSYNDGD